MQLSGLDALFLYAETPAMHLHVALTAILDPTDAPVPLTLDRLRALVGDRLPLVPPFTRRLVDAPLGITHPSWVDLDPSEVDVEYHVRATSLPQPGGPEDLGARCGAIASVPLDRTRPLWEMWLIDGLYDGNLALLTKIHHACIDGVSGAELITVFFDLEPTPTPAPDAAPSRTVPAPTDGSSGNEPAAPTDGSSGNPEAEPADDDDRPPESPHHEGAPSEIELITDAVRHRIETLRTLPPLFQRTVAGVLDVRRRRAVRAESGGTPLRAPRLSFNGRLSPARNCAFAHVPLAEAQELRRTARCTLNDLLLGVLAGALRAHLQARGELPEGPLVAACPVSVRGADEHGQQNNKVSILLTRLHTEIEDPVERLLAIRRATNAGKAEHLLVGPGALVEWSEAIDPTLVRWVAQAYLRSGLSDHHPPTHNVVVSNVPGPGFPVYLAGTTLVRAYPMGPITEGAAMNITVMSYLDSVDIGFMVCPDLVPDVWDLADRVAPAFAELRAVLLPEQSRTGGAPDTDAVSTPI